jgi:hypothetical protein
MRALGLDESLLRVSTRDAVAFDARRGRGRDADIVEAPTDVDPDASERQAGVDRRRFGRARDQEETRGFGEMGASVEEPEANSALFATDDEERAREVREQDEEHWGMNYDKRRDQVYALLRGSENISHDEAEAYISRFGVGKMPRSAMSPPGNIGGRLAKQPTRSNGIDQSGQGLEDINKLAGRIEIAGGHGVRSNIDSDPAYTRTGELQTKEDHLRAIGRDLNRLGGRDQMLSFASNQRPQVRPQIASDAAADSFYSMFPDAARLRSDGSGWNR